MGPITSICSRQKQRSSRRVSRISRLNKGSDQNVIVQKLLFHQIADVFPYKYLGKGLYGTTVEVYVKEKKEQKFAEKIIPQENMIENYICYEPEVVDRVMLDPVLRHRIVKVHAYSINNQKSKMYLIMDLMKKSDLYFHLCRVQKKNGRFFSQKAIKRVAYELLQILERFHSYGLIFRNLRSENVFIKDNGKLAVSDFFFAINGVKCHTYYGAAEYAPPQVYYMEKAGAIKTVNEGVMRNLNEISDATEERQLRLSPDLRRYNMNTKSTFYKLTKSCDLKDQIQETKFKNKRSHDFQTSQETVEKLSENVNQMRMKRIDSKDSIPESREDSSQAYRKNLRHLTTLNLPMKEVRDREKHLTYTIPQEPFGQSSQVKQDTIKVGPGFRVQFDNNIFHTQQQQDIDSNVSSMGFGRAYDKSVDFWMLGVLLFELIFGRTPFEKWKGTCDVLSKTPACPSYAENLVDLEHHVKNKDVQEIWPRECAENGQAIVSLVEKAFIEQLLVREPEKRKTLPELQKHLFLSDCDMKTPIEELIYEQAFDPEAFQKEMKQFVKNKDSGLVASRTILKKTCKSSMAKARITQKLFDHEKSVYEG